MKLSQYLRERNTTTGKQLGTTRLKLLAEPRQELKDALKLQIRAHSQTAGTGGTHNCTKRIKLTPNSSTLSIELINSRITLLNSMLLANHRQVKSIPRRLIALTKKSPLRSSSGKTHELSSLLRQNIGSENNSSTSILIYPLSVVSQILGSIGGKSNRRRRSSG